MLHNHRREVSFSKIWENSSPFGIQKGPTLFGCWGYFKPPKYGLILVMIESSSFWSRIMVGSLNVRDPWLHSFSVLNQRNSEMNRGKEVEWEWWWSDCVTTTCWVIKSNATSPRVDMLWAVGFTSKITQWSRIKPLPPHFSWFQGGYTNQSSDRSVILTSQVTFWPFPWFRMLQEKMQRNWRWTVFGHCFSLTNLISSHSCHKNLQKPTR